MKIVSNGLFDSMTSFATSNLFLCFLLSNAEFKSIVWSCRNDCKPSLCSDLL